MFRRFKPGVSKTELCYRMRDFNLANNILQHQLEICISSWSQFQVRIINQVATNQPGRCIFSPDSLHACIHNTVLAWLPGIITRKFIERLSERHPVPVCRLKWHKQDAEYYLSEEILPPPPPVISHQPNLLDKTEEF